MSKTIVVVGFGPGISTAVADKFGAEGFSVALVARTLDRHAASPRRRDRAAGRPFFAAAARARTAASLSVAALTPRWFVVVVGRDDGVISLAQGAAVERMEKERHAVGLLLGVGLVGAEAWREEGQHRDEAAGNQRRDRD